MRFHPAILALGACLALPASAAPVAPRFSHSLTSTEQAEAGVSRLTSDEAAVLDALVRRDIGGQADLRDGAEKPAEFSKRLSDDERRLTGLVRLEATEVARLDELVTRITAARLARTLLAPPAFLRRSRIEPAETAERGRVHGSFMFSMGWGSGGYSERTGAVMLNYDDPAGRYSVTIGYSESHIKGGDGIIWEIDSRPYRPGWPGNSLDEAASRRGERP